MPALTHFYGLRPSDIDDMSLREVAEYQQQMAAYQAEEARNS